MESLELTRNVAGEIKTVAGGKRLSILSQIEINMNHKHRQSTGKNFKSCDHCFFPAILQFKKDNTSDNRQDQHDVIVTNHDRKRQKKTDQHVSPTDSDRCGFLHHREIKSRSHQKTVCGMNERRTAKSIES